jgi:hypothetical protein
MIAFISPCPLARLVAGVVAHGLSFAQLNFRGEDIVRATASLL